MKYRVECRRRRDDKIQKNFQEFDSLVKYIERRAMDPHRTSGIPVRTGEN